MAWLCSFGFVVDKRRYWNWRMVKKPVPSVYTDRLVCIGVKKIMALQEIEWVIFDHFQSTGNMHVSILSRRYSSSRNPYARRWMTRILLLSPSTKPSETLFSGLQ